MNSIAQLLAGLTAALTLTASPAHADVEIGTTVQAKVVHHHTCARDVWKYLERQGTGPWELKNRRVKHHPKACDAA